MPTVSWDFDGGKKVNGRKRHIVVDTLGLLLTVLGTAACITDRDAGTTMLERLRQRHWRITLVWADSVYPDRSAVPGKLWRMLFSKAINDIGVLL